MLPYPVTAKIPINRCPFPVLGHHPFLVMYLWNSVVSPNVYFPDHSHGISPDTPWGGQQQQRKQHWQQQRQQWWRRLSLPGQIREEKTLRRVPKRRSQGQKSVSPGDPVSEVWRSCLLSPQSDCLQMLPGKTYFEEKWHWWLIVYSQWINYVKRR